MGRDSRIERCVGSGRIIGRLGSQMGRTLLDKVWDAHAVRELPNGQTQLFIGLHLVHEVTSPQAFQMLRERGLKVRYPDRTFATVDHIIPTDGAERPFADGMAEPRPVLHRRARAVDPGHGLSEHGQERICGCARGKSVASGLEIPGLLA